MQYYEDIEVEEPESFGSISVPKDEIVDFATQFDPQPIHVDEEAARESMYDGIIASGLHTLCLTIRLYSDEFLQDVAFVVGRGLKDVRFLAPVFPGDTLSIRVEVIDKWDSPSDPNWGELEVGITTTNQAGTEVLSLIDPSIVKRRVPSDGEHITE
ncbi:MaoC/PaaZ C-terminal domain-containing protein [Natrinema sp. 74]|uniref:MaoC/PaaZ C-terminal domain-containing protein n=1 Tax=Natrinema sp. 74 TaxID=3384159 RepID=UPI0038D3B713